MLIELKRIHSAASRKKDLCEQREWSEAAGQRRAGHVGRAASGLVWSGPARYGMVGSADTSDTSDLSQHEMLSDVMLEML